MLNRMLKLGCLTTVALVLGCGPSAKDAPPSISSDNQSGGGAEPAKKPDGKTPGSSAPTTDVKPLGSG